MNTETETMLDILIRVEKSLVEEANFRHVLAKSDGDTENIEDGDLKLQILQWIEETGFDVDEPDMMFDDCLDIEIHGKKIGTGWEVTRLEFLLAYGGPTYRLSYDGSQAFLHGAWWGDSAEVMVIDKNVLSELQNYDYMLEEDS